MAYGRMLPMPFWFLWGCVQFAWSFVGLLLPCMPRMSRSRGAAGTERGTWPNWANGAARGTWPNRADGSAGGAWPGWHHRRSRACGGQRPHRACWTPRANGIARPRWSQRISLPPLSVRPSFLPMGISCFCFRPLKTSLVILPSRMCSIFSFRPAIIWCRTVYRPFLQIQVICR